MGSVMIDSGDFPKAEGVSGGNLDRVVNKWSRKISSGFNDGAEWLLKAIEEVDRLELWKTYWNGMYGTREQFIKAVLLLDFNVVEHTIPAILERLHAGESVNLERTNGERVEFIPPLRPNGGDRKSDQYDKNENVRLINDYGNASTYRIAKLKRDAPEFAERYQAGEFKTVREAERAAGFPVPPKLTALERVYRAFERLSTNDKLEFLRRIE
jgi:hypothetical protein